MKLYKFMIKGDQSIYIDGVEFVNVLAVVLADILFDRGRSVIPKRLHLLIRTPHSTAQTLEARHVVPGCLGLAGILTSGRVFVHEKKRSRPAR